MNSPIDPTGPDLDRKVPAGIMRITQHYHNLIYIRAFWESIGQQPPDWIKKEMTRVDAVLQRELDHEAGQGGLLHGDEDEARQSEPRWKRRL